MNIFLDEVENEGPSKDFSKDFSFVTVATSSCGEIVVLDYSAGFADAEAFPNGILLEDSCVSCNVELNCLSVYKLSSFKFWKSHDWESGICDDWGWEANKAELLYVIKD